MKTKVKKIPKFKSEDQERRFWAKNDVTEFFNIRTAKKMHLPKLKPSTQTISLRLPEDLLEEIKVLANKRDVPYQSLIKILLRERIDDRYNQCCNPKTPLAHHSKWTFEEPADLSNKDHQWLEADLNENGNESKW